MKLHKKLLITSGFTITTILNVHAQALVGDFVPVPLGLTEVDPSQIAPLQNPRGVEFSDFEGEVVLITYHASW